MCSQKDLISEQRIVLFSWVLIQLDKWYLAWISSNFDYVFIFLKYQSYFFVKTTFFLVSTFRLKFLQFCLTFWRCVAILSPNKALEKYVSAFFYDVTKQNQTEALKKSDCWSQITMICVADQCSACKRQLIVIKDHNKTTKLK